MFDDNSYLRLNILGLPVIHNIDDFSLLTHISKYTIYQLSIHSNKYYKTYSVPKKNGNLRNIAQPSKKLKGLQAWVLVNILNKLKVSESCKGFEKNTSTADNAAPHIGANIVVSIDLKDFFPSVKKKSIYNIFKSIGYNSNIATILTNICIFNEGLPQGSPCSPKLANLALWSLDNRIQGYVGKKGITYTRYADDLSFSGFNPNKVCKILPTIKKIVENENFQLNDDKTRVAGASKAKKVTGLIINQKSFGIGKKSYKILRAKIHHLSFPEKQSDEKFFLHVKGWLSYVNSVDKNRHKKVIKYIENLSVKHPTLLVSKLLEKG